MKIISIGNSFSQDAQTYLHQIAANEGVAIDCTNLFIGGCSLERHYDNLMHQTTPYELHQNGIFTENFTHISEALSSETWDYVTLQQVSNLSPFYESYQPYLNELANYVRKKAPTAKILIHQTWAYSNEKLIDHPTLQSPIKMLEALEGAYLQAANAIHANGIIPSGRVLMSALENGIATVHRDGAHASFGIGRYLLGLTWYSFLTKKQAKNDFDHPELDATPCEKKLAKQTVSQVLKIN